MMITGIEATRPQCGEKSVAEIGKRKKRGARLYEIPGIEATRPQCGKKAWRKSEIERSAERAYTRFPELKPRARGALLLCGKTRFDATIRSGLSAQSCQAFSLICG